jgi:hypothetical protein
MPTKKWFEENPKVTAYISRELHRKLEEYMAERSLKKISQAITAILEEKLLGKDKSRDDELRKQVDELRAKVDQHEQFMFRVISGGLQSMSAPASVEVLPDRRYNQLSIVGETKSEEKKVTQSKPPVAQTKVVTQSKSKKVTASKPEPSPNWMTMREAFNTYGQGFKWDYFRKMTPEQFKEKVGIEADLSRKKGNKGLPKGGSRWLRKTNS